MSTARDLASDWRIWLLAFALLVAFSIDVGRCQRESSRRQAKSFEEQSQWSKEYQEELQRQGNRYQEPPASRFDDGSTSSFNSMFVNLELPSSLSKAKDNILVGSLNLGDGSTRSTEDFRTRPGWTYETIRRPTSWTTIPFNTGYTAISISGYELMTVYCLIKVDEYSPPKLITPEDDVTGQLPREFYSNTLLVSGKDALAKQSVLFVNKLGLSRWNLRVPVLHLTEVRASATSQDSELYQLAAPNFDVTLTKNNDFRPLAFGLRETSSDGTLDELSFLVPVGSIVTQTVRNPNPQDQVNTAKLDNGTEIISRHPIHWLQFSEDKFTFRRIKATDVNSKVLPNLSVRIRDPWLRELETTAELDGSRGCVLPGNKSATTNYVELWVPGYEIQVFPLDYRWSLETPMLVKFEKIETKISVMVDYPDDVGYRNCAMIVASFGGKDSNTKKTILEVGLPTTGLADIPCKNLETSWLILKSDYHFFQKLSQSWSDDRKTLKYHYTALPICRLEFDPVDAHGLFWPKNSRVVMTLSPVYDKGIHSNDRAALSADFREVLPKEFLFTGKFPVVLTPGEWDATLAAPSSDGLLEGRVRFTAGSSEYPPVIEIPIWGFRPWKSFKIKDQVHPSNSPNTTLFWPLSELGSISDPASWSAFKQAKLGRNVTTPEIGRTMSSNGRVWAMQSHDPNYVVLPSGFRSRWFCIPEDKSGVFQAEVDAALLTIEVSRPVSFGAVEFDLSAVDALRIDRAAFTVGV